MTRQDSHDTLLSCSELVSSHITYFEYDWSTRLLLQDTWETEGLQVRVGVINEACVVVREKSLDVVEHKAKLIYMFDGLLVRGVLCLQRGGETADGGCVQHFAHLEPENIFSIVRVQTGPLPRPCEI